MTETYTYRNLTWTDLESPSDEEIRSVMNEYSISPFIAEELISLTPRPKIDLVGNAVFAILHFPAVKHTHRHHKNQEIDFIIGTDFLITVHYDTVDAIHKFSKVFEVRSVLDKDERALTGGDIFFHLVRKLYKSVSHELEYVHDMLEDIDKKMFEGREREMVNEISKVARELLNFKKVIGGHKKIIGSLEKNGDRLFGKEFTAYSTYLNYEYDALCKEISSSIEEISELRETNNSLVTTKQNEIMKVLTIMAFVTFPLSLISSIFGMNTGYLPIVGHPYDFWIIIAGMVMLTSFFFAFFKYRGWL